MEDLEKLYETCDVCWNKNASVHYAYAFKIAVCETCRDLMGELEFPTGRFTRRHLETELRRRKKVGKLREKGYPEKSARLMAYGLEVEVEMTPPTDTYPMPPMGV